MLKKFSRDLGDDLLTIILELVGVVVKVALIYALIGLATDLPHDVALETAILVGAVDFLNSQRTHLKTVSDVKDRISITERGKKITRTITKHTTKRS